MVLQEKRGGVEGNFRTHPFYGRCAVRTRWAFLRQFASQYFVRGSGVLTSLPQCPHLITNSTCIASTICFSPLGEVISTRTIDVTAIGPYSVYPRTSGMDIVAAVASHPEHRPMR